MTWVGQDLLVLLQGPSLVQTVKVIQSVMSNFTTYIIGRPVPVHKSEGKNTFNKTTKNIFIKVYKKE